MDKKTIFIVNPISGKGGKGPQRKRRVDDFIKARGMNAVSFETQYPGHATELSRQALDDGAQRVVCMGGDGTINEVAKVMVGSGVAFGLIPMGSGNGLARHLGIPLKIDKALENILSGNEREIDTGEANGHAFFNVMGIGLDAEIGKRFNDTHARGFMSYLKEGFKAFRDYRSSDYSIQANGTKLDLNAYIVAIANSSQYGSNAYIAPNASVRDGKLNLVAIRTPGLLGSLDLLWRIFTKAIYGSKKVESLESDSYHIQLQQPGFFHADGEIFNCGDEIEILVRSNSLRIIAPQPLS